MDADLSHDPSVLGDLLAEIEGGADIVIGTRYMPGGEHPRLAVAPAGDLPGRQPLRPLDARPVGPRRHLRLPGLPPPGAGADQPHRGAGRRLRLPGGDGLQGRPGRRPPGRGADRVPRPHARQVEDVVPDRRRGARPRHLVGPVRAASGPAGSSGRDPRRVVGTAHHPPRRPRRLLRLGRGPREPGAGREARPRRRHRAPGRGGRRLLRGPPLRRATRPCRWAGPGGSAPRRSCFRPASTLYGAKSRAVHEIFRPSPRSSSRSPSTRPSSTSPAPRGLLRLRRRDRRRHPGPGPGRDRPDRLGRRGPQQAAGQAGQRRRQARRDAGRRAGRPSWPSSTPTRSGGCGASARPPWPGWNASASRRSATSPPSPRPAWSTPSAGPTATSSTSWPAAATTGRWSPTGRRSRSARRRPSPATSPTGRHCGREVLRMAERVGSPPPGPRPGRPHRHAQGPLPRLPHDHPLDHRCPSRSPVSAEIARLALALLDKVDTSGGIRLLGVTREQPGGRGRPPGVALRRGGSTPDGARRLSSRFVRRSSAAFRTRHALGTEPPHWSRRPSNPKCPICTPDAMLH